MGPPHAAPELLAHLPCGKTSGAGTRPSRAPNPTPQSRFRKELPFTLPEGRLTSSPLLAPTCSLMSPTSCRCASCLSRARTPVSVASPKPWDGAPLPAEASSSSTPCIPAAPRAPGPPRGGNLGGGPPQALELPVAWAAAPCVQTGADGQSGGTLPSEERHLLGGRDPHTCLFLCAAEPAASRAEWQGGQADAPLGLSAGAPMDKLARRLHPALPRGAGKRASLGLDLADSGHPC